MKTLPGFSLWADGDGAVCVAAVSLPCVDGADFGRKSWCASPKIVDISAYVFPFLKALLEHLCCRLAPPAGVHPLCCACLCFMLLFALVCPVVGWCCRSRLLLCSGCFAAIAPLGRMLRRHVARAVALPPVSPRSPFSRRCLTIVSVMAPHLADALLLQSSQADALSPFMLDSWWILCHHGFSPLLATIVLM